MKSVAGASSAPLSRRAVLRGLAGGLAAALAVACGSNAGGDTTARPIQSQAIAGKVLWEIRTEPTYAELAKQALPIFKQTHPQIEVEFTPKPPSWQMLRLGRRTESSMLLHSALAREIVTRYDNLGRNGELLSVHELRS